MKMEYDRDVVQNNSEFYKRMEKRSIPSNNQTIPNCSRKKKLKFNFIGEWGHPRNQKIASLNMSEFLDEFFYEPIEI